MRYRYPGSCDYAQDDDKGCDNENDNENDYDYDNDREKR